MRTLKGCPPREDHHGQGSPHRGDRRHPAEVLRLAHPAVLEAGDHIPWQQACRRRWAWILHLVDDHPLLVLQVQRLRLFRVKSRTWTPIHAFWVLPR